MNKVILIGNLGADPEFRMAGDQRVASFRMATSETWKDKATGKREVRTEWHRVVVWDQGTVKYLEKAAKKGTKVSLIGKITTRKWTGNDGVERYATEIVINPDGDLTVEDGGIEREAA